MLNATIDEQENALNPEDAWYMRATLPVDIYNTEEPQIQFDDRTKFCLEMHNATVKVINLEHARR